jgi:uncharacterized protein (DUF433 family)
MRIGNTRVLLDLVVAGFWRGESPETLVEMYTTLSLEDVYLVIGYYLRHRAEIDKYIAEQEAEAKKIEAQVRADFPPKLTREILMERLERKKQAQGYVTSPQG